MSEKPTKITSTDFLDPLSADMRLTQQLMEQLPASRKQQRLKNKSAFLYVQFFQQCRKQMKNWLSSGFIFKEPEVILHPERWAEAEKFTLSQEFYQIQSHGDVNETPRKALLQSAILRCKSVPFELNLEQLAPYQTKEERIENTAFLPKDKVEVLEDCLRRIEVFNRDFSTRNPSVCVLKEFRPRIRKELKESVYKDYDGSPDIHSFRGSLTMTVWFLTARKTFFQVKMEWKSENNQVRYTFTEHDSHHLIGRFCDKYFNYLQEQLRYQTSLAEKINNVEDDWKVMGGDDDDDEWSFESFLLPIKEQSDKYWDEAHERQHYPWRQWPRILQVRPERGGLGLLNWFQL